MSTVSAPLRTLLATTILLSTGPTLANPKLINLPANTWYRVPNSRLIDVAPAEKSLWDRGIHCVQGPAAVIWSWSGGAYDPARHTMLVWGGGHADYCGNELYAFDVDRLTWARYTEPSMPPFDRDPLDDGAPVSRHTYDGMQFLTHAKRLWAYGGARSRDGRGTDLTWVFDMATRKWTNRMPAGKFKPGAGHLYNLSSAYDPVSHKVFMRDPHHLYAYDYDANLWTRLHSRSHTWEQQRGVVDPQRRLLFTIGMGEFLVWDIDAGKDVSSDWVTTGGAEIISAPAPGVDYDAQADALVAWRGGSVWSLDLRTKRWSSKSGIGAPPAQPKTGTFGRWRYIAEYNVFILVNSASDDVLFYKHTAGAGSTHR